MGLKHLLLPLLLLVSCTKESHPENKTNPFRLRSRAKINAERDTKEGYLEASNYLKRLIDQKLDNATDHLNLSKVLYFLEDFSGCKTHLDRVRTLSDKNNTPPDLDYMSGLFMKHKLQYKEALKFFTSVIRKKPDHPNAWFQRGEVEVQLERYEDAVKSYQKVLSVHPEHRAGIYRLIFVLRKLQRKEDLIKYQKLFASLPKTGRINNEMCDLTMVTLRPLNRSELEPTGVSFSWTDITDRFLTTDISSDAVRAIPYYRGKKAQNDSVSVSWGTSVFMEEGNQNGPDLLLVRSSGIDILTHPNDKTTPVKKIFSTISAKDIKNCHVADFNNDGLNDILARSDTALIIYRANEESAFEPAQELLSHNTTHAGIFDVDHDGDLDIIAIIKTAEAFNALFVRNNGNNTFKTFSLFEDLQTSEATEFTFTAHDVDQGNDLDFIFAGDPSGIQVFLNLRDGTFSNILLPGFSNRNQVIVEDLNNDGAPDFFATGGTPGWTYAMNADPQGNPRSLNIEKPVNVSSPHCGEISDSCSADIDNDGDLDILLASSSGVVLLRNTGGGKFIEEEAVKLPGKAKAVTIDVTDLTGDGMLEVLSGTDTDKVVILSSGANPPYASWKIWLEGKKDNNNAIGTVVEQYSESLYQSTLIRKSGPLHLGLGKKDRSKIDGIRFRWPQGIIQTTPDFEIKPDSHGNVRFTQIEALVSSCPFLYTRGKNGWKFITDVLGIAPLDEWLPEGEKPLLDPEEFVRIRGNELISRNGLLQIAVTEELKETAYLDRLELISVDHPESHRIYINESTNQKKYETLKLVIIPETGLSVPASFKSADGTEQKDTISFCDKNYLHGYGRAPAQWGGWVKQYNLQITTKSRSCGLLLTGRIAWYDSTVIYSLNQHGRSWSPMSLQLLKESGNSLTLLEDLGLPAGMDRNMIAFLPAPPLPAETRLQLSCQHRFLWDQVLLISESEQLELTQSQNNLKLQNGKTICYTTCRVKNAVCSFHGFSTTQGSKALHEQYYLYEKAAPGDMFPPATGFSTRYGDVTQLLHKHDDLLVVLIAGDKVEVDFEAPADPPPGMKRTYFLRVSGWAKEGSYHNLTGSYIAPLPFRNMTQYPPPPEEQRQDRAYKEYLEKFQTRKIRRRFF